MNARRAALLAALSSGALLSSATAALSQGAPQDVGPDKWWFQVTPYLWAASIKGGNTVGDFTVPIDVDFGDIWSKLKFAFSAHAEFGKGRLPGG